MKIKIKYFFACIIAFAICTWLGLILIYQHNVELKKPYEKSTMLEAAETFTDLSYQPYMSDIIRTYVGLKSKPTINSIYFKFEDEIDIYKEISCNAVWSAAKIDAEVIYPYWWYFTYGAT